MKKITYLLLMVFPFITMSQNWDLEIQKELEQNPIEVIEIEDGSFLVAGINVTEESDFEYTPILSKISRDGQLQWTKQFEVEESDNGNFFLFQINDTTHFFGFSWLDEIFHLFIDQEGNELGRKYYKDEFSNLSRLQNVQPSKAGGFQILADIRGTEVMFELLEIDQSGQFINNSEIIVADETDESTYPHDLRFENTSDNGMILYATRLGEKNRTGEWRIGEPYIIKLDSNQHELWSQQVRFEDRDLFGAGLIHVSFIDSLGYAIIAEANKDVFENGETKSIVEYRLILMDQFGQIISQQVLDENIIPRGGFEFGGPFPLFDNDPDNQKLSVLIFGHSYENETFSSQLVIGEFNFPSLQYTFQQLTWPCKFVHPTNFIRTSDEKFMTVSFTAASGPWATPDEFDYYIFNTKIEDDWQPENNCPTIVSLDEISNKLDFKIYPNPANDFINIDLLNYHDKDPLSVRVYDNLGREVFTNPKVSFPVKLKIKTLNPGVHFIQVSSGDQLLLNRKILITR